MTTTEDRLTDALDSAARSVTASSLRPLDEAPAPGHSPADPRTRRRRRWLAAVASGAAIALIAGLVVAISDGLRTASETTGPGVPRYYAEIGLRSGRLLIRATATGRVTAVVPSPGSRRWLCQGVTTADDRTFFALFGTRRDPGRIYRFQVTPAGRVSHLMPVPGRSLGHNWVVAIAPSPSGSQLAVALRPDILSHRNPEKIVVLSTRTGARTTWAGGRPPRGLDPQTSRISQLSWTANGRELVYLGYWTCSAGHSELCAHEGLFGYEEVRTLNPAGPGGTLTSGRLLLRRADGDLEAAAISPDGSVLTAVRQRQLHGRPRQRMTVTQFDARTGRQLRILYSVTTFSDDFVNALVPDPAGRYFIVVGSGQIGGTAAGTLNGWIGHGRLHRLRPVGADVSSGTW